ncbi:Metacaspase-4 [Tetrabaena socialis]|uniref:Metacaspase-4 n=1 Tax=Tetrabaena socialis TaxID=47790 RepID=A0A2J8AIP2_9CHLO|nr:Metacaspase-4 [Tetrabaena socialis]|eukprot:PNH12389.1 Metacaspase-4 [Tetrabaena socialis]
MSKKAVLIGCNYPGTNAALNGCINDVWGMKAMLEQYYGFDPANIFIMIDTDPQYMRPDGKNMKVAKISELVTNAVDGDVLVLHFSGHGTQIPSQGEAGETDGKDEAICPTDLNVICDDDLRVLIKPLEAKPGVKFTFIADCCHSGSLLDHEAVQISGPKAGGPPPPQLDEGTLAGFLGSLGQPNGGRDFQNRALPFNDLCSMLSSLLGGQAVNASNVRSTLGTAFGADASAKIQQFMQVYQMFANGGLTNAGGGGGGGGLMAMLCSCFSPPAAADQNGPSGQPANATTGPGANYATGNLAEPNLNIQLPPAGAKPPAEQRLNKDVGILITGCQSNETSADACPSGNPAKAHGALSNAMQTIVKQHHAANPGVPLSYRNLVIAVRELLLKTGFAQNPCLECSNLHADEPFIVR